MRLSHTPNTPGISGKTASSPHQRSDMRDSRNMKILDIAPLIQDLRITPTSFVSRTRCSVLTLLRRAWTHQRDVLDGPRIAAHHAARHSASKTRVNALMALRSFRGTQDLDVGFACSTARYAAPVSLPIQLFLPTSASTGASASPPTTAPNAAKNSPANFFAVESIKRWPSCASLPPICASTS